MSFPREKGLVKSVRNLSPPTRTNWSTLRGCIDLAKVATDLLGPAPGRRGERGKHLWWPCPFHEDRNPSFCVTPGRSAWQCYGCGKFGDAITLVRHFNPTWSFQQAMVYLAGNRVPLVGQTPTTSRKSGKPTPIGAGRASALSTIDALDLASESERSLWSPSGTYALRYLRGRGLTDASIRRARLGWTCDTVIAAQEGKNPWRVTGVVIPWFDGDRLSLIKLRKLGDHRPKYMELYRNHPSLFPSPSVIQVGKPLVLVEGEFDALLLGQAIGDLAAVVTLGSASARPDIAFYGDMLAAPTWFIATDADDAGDRCASGWPALRTSSQAPCPLQGLDGVRTRLGEPTSLVD